MLAVLLTLMPGCVMRHTGIGDGVAISGDGTQIALPVERGGKWHIEILNSTTMEVVSDYFVAEGEPSILAFRPQGGDVFFVITRHGGNALESSIWHLPAGQSHAVQWTNWGGIIEAMDVSANGTLVFWRGHLEAYGWAESGNRSADLFATWPGSQNERRLTSWAAYFAHEISISPTGEVLYMGVPNPVAGPGLMRIELSTMKGTEVGPSTSQLLDAGIKYMGSVSLSDDGTILAFSAVDLDGKSGIYSWNFRSLQLRFLSHTPNAGAIALSNDGNIVVFTDWHRSFPSHAFVARAPNFEPVEVGI